MKTWIIRALSVTLSLPLAGMAMAESARPIYAWADVSIASTGVPDDVKLVVPPLPPTMAAPIENVIRSWSFAPGNKGGVSVPRTTSVGVVIRLVTSPDGGSRIEAEKFDEGPRILRRADHRCLEKMDGAVVRLSFTVTAEGRVVDISGTDPEDARQQCAIAVMRDTTFKPETVNGKAISSEVTMNVRFK